MRLSGKTGLVILGCVSASLFFACKTTGPAVPVTEPPKQPPAERPAEKKNFTRAGFAAELKALLDQDRNDEAIALFETVPEPDASDLSIRILKLSVLISAKRLEQATALAAELEARYPDSTDVLYTQAVLCGANKDAPGREKYLARILELDPGNSLALTETGTDQLSRKSYKTAKLSFLKAIESDPGNSGALLGLARVYYMEADLDKAGNTLSMALSKNPENSAIWAEQARVKSENKDLPGALKDIAKAVEIDPDVASHWLDYGNYLISSARKEEARKAFTEVIRLDPESYIAYIYRAGLDDDLGFTDEAIADYRKCCQIYPQYYYAAESLGILLWEKGDWEGAGKAFELAVYWNPKNAPYALMRTLCLYRMNRGEEAKGFMAKYITTLDRNKTEYFLCRLFVDRSGDGDVLNRIMGEKDLNVRNRMLFYSAMYYELFQSRTVAQKYYAVILSDAAPSFFEYRLCKRELGIMGTEGAAGEPDGSGTNGNAGPASSLQG